MSDRFWRHLSICMGFIAFFMLFGLITFSSSLEIKDLDLWLHLKMGQWIVQHGFVPDYDVLSCTISGKPWVNHEWLFQVIVYEIQHHFGYDGLIYMQSMVVALTFLILIYLTYSHERQQLILVLLLMVLMIYQSRFTIRPDIFSLLFFVLFIYLLAVKIHERAVMYLLVGLQIIWSNMHGFFFFGPLLVGIGILAEFIKRHLPMPYTWNNVGRLADQEYGTLKKLFVLLILASCINPLTFRGAWYPIHVLLHLGGDNKIFFTHIVELQKPILANDIWTDKYLYYKVLIFISALSFVFNRQKIDISSFFIWVIFLGFSLVAIRNLAYFAVAAFIVFMVNIVGLTWENFIPLRFTSVKFKHITGILTKFGLMFWMLNFVTEMSGNGYFDYDTYKRKSEYFGVSKRSYPYKAVDFLVKNHVQGNFFNDFNSGAYLVGRASPDIKVFIDGRTEEYGPKFFAEYQKIWQDGNVKVFKDFEHKYNITGAFLNNYRQEIPRNVLKMFQGFKDWSIVYLDDDAVIFLRQTTHNMPLIGRYKIDITKWQTKPMDLIKISTRPVDPFPMISRAYILETLGADKAAFSEAQEALKVSANYGPAFKMLGQIYAKQKDYSKAFEAYRFAVMYSSESAGRLGLAEALENLKEYPEAIIQYQKYLDKIPKDARAMYGLARTYAKQGQDKKALAVLSDAKRLGLEDKVDVQKIHDIIGSKKKRS